MAARAEIDLALNSTQASAGLKTFQGRIEKAATATSGMASALGSVGGSAGAATGAISNLAAAFIEGGPLLVGVAGAALAVGVLGEKWLEAGKKAEEARRKQIEAATGIKAALKDLVESKQLELWAKQQGEGITDAERMLEKFNRRAEDARATLSGLQLELTATGVFGGLDPAEKSAIEDKIKEQQKIVDGIEKERESIEGLAQRAANAERKLAKLDERQEKGRKRTVSATKAFEDQWAWLNKLTPTLDDHVRAWEEYNREISRVVDSGTAVLLAEEFERQDSLEAARERGRLRELDATADHEKKRAELVRAGQAEMARIIWSTYAQAEGAVQSFTGTTLQVLEDLAAGQEVHFDRIMFSFLRQQGESIMGLSTRFGFEAAGRLISTQGADMAAWGLLAHAGSGFALGASMGATGAVGSGLSQRFGGLGMTIPAAGGGEAAGGGPVALDQTRAVSRRTEAESVSTTIVFQGTVFGDPAKQGRELARMQDTARSDYLERV